MNHHKSFKSSSGLITIRIKNDTHKFCKLCGYRMRGEATKLKKHFNKQHPGSKPAWL